MIVAKIYGGLGNQLFQYAAAMSYGLKLNQEVMIDNSWFENIPKVNTHREYSLDKFQINLKKFPIKYGILTKKFFPYIIFDKKIFKLINETNLVSVKKRGNYIFDDYFQGLNFFKENNNWIINTLRVNYELEKNETSILDEIKKNNSVAIHIRRGDYVTNIQAAIKHGVCNINYYINAIGLIKKYIKNSKFYIFSDDINWTKENFKFLDNKKIIDLKFENSPVTDLIMMSNCSHHIIANSSFSWWGAWLSFSNSSFQKEKIIIAPKNWYLKGYTSPHLIPKEWLML